MKTIKIILLAACLTIVSAGCVNYTLTMPEGPKGESGLSAYELWVNDVKNGVVDWDPSRTEVNDYFIYRKGQDGKPGKDGQNGKSAYEVWKEFISGGTVDDPLKPGEKWPADKNTMQDFYRFLTGPKGDNGNTPYIGENGNWFIGGTDTNIPAKGPDGKDGADGKDGKDGKSAYEVWKQAVGGGTIEYEGDTTLADFFVYYSGKNGIDGKRGADGADGKDGKDGEDGKNGKDGRNGNTPRIGENGHWFIGSTDTGIPATGADGKSGKDGSEGSDGNDGKSAYELWVEDVRNGLVNPGNGIFDANEYPNWPKNRISKEDYYLYLSGKPGADGKNGKSAYELWVEEIKGGNVVDPADSSKTWPVADSTVQDFFRYLSGQNGKSAYEIWKDAVANGLDNPDNGIYDKKGYEKWPLYATTIDDFYNYMRGKNGADGFDGQDGNSVIIKNITTYSLWKVDKNRFNLVPVATLRRMSKESLTSPIDTTYEYVNPISGGLALMLLGPGPVLLPNSTVKVRDVLGNDHTLTSDNSGYIYLKRNELPEWHEGAPSGDTDLRPYSLTFGGRTYGEEAFAPNCKIPYRINLEVRIDSAYLYSVSTYLVYHVNRVIEGKMEENRWPGSNSWSTNSSSYPMVRNEYYLADSDYAGKDGKYRCLNFFNSTVYFTNVADYTEANLLGGNFNRNLEYSENSGRLSRTITEPGKSGNQYASLCIGSSRETGAYPERMEVGASLDLSMSQNCPDYGANWFSYLCDGKLVEVPELNRIGSLDTTSVVPVKNVSTGNMEMKKGTRYEIALGETSFYVRFNPDTFGPAYVNKMYRKSGSELSLPNVSEMLMFQRYDSFRELVASGIYEPSDFNWKCKLLGKLGGVSVSSYSDISGLNFVEGLTSNPRSWEIKNVYDGFWLYFDYFGYKPENTTNHYYFYYSRNGKFATESKDGKDSSLKMTSPAETFSFPTINK